MQYAKNAEQRSMMFLCVLHASMTNPRNIDCSHLGRGDDITFTSDRGRSLRRTAFSTALWNWNPNASRLATMANQQRLFERDRSSVASATSVRISPKQFPMIRSITPIIINDPDNNKECGGYIGPFMLSLGSPQGSRRGRGDGEVRLVN